MINFLLFAFQAQAYVNTLKSDESRQLTLNYTSAVESVIVKFQMQNAKMVCVVSPADLSELQLSISDLSLSQRKSLLYDYQGFLTNSPFQLVQIDYTSTINLRCVSFDENAPEVDFELYYSSSQAGGCISDCNGYYYPNTTDSVCVEDECHCLSGSFGWFCQFQAVQIQSNTPSVFVLDPGQWQYLSYQFASTAITFTSDNTANHNLCTVIHIHQHLVLYQNSHRNSQFHHLRIVFHQQYP